jgi:endonuclease YncB( thermonuclease family)
MLRNNRIIKLFFVLSALLLSASAQPQTITGKVVGVSDGDTLTGLDEQKRQLKIRLEGIDAPESNRGVFKTEADAQAAGYRKAVNVGLKGKAGANAPAMSLYNDDSLA